MMVSGFEILKSKKSISKINALMWNYQKNNSTKFPEALTFYHH